MCVCVFVRVDPMIKLSSQPCREHNKNTNTRPTDQPEGHAISVSRFTYVSEVCLCFCSGRPNDRVVEQAL